MHSLRSISYTLGAVVLTLKATGLSFALATVSVRWTSWVSGPARENLINPLYPRVQHRCQTYGGSQEYEEESIGQTFWEN